VQQRLVCLLRRNRTDPAAAPDRRARQGARAQAAPARHAVVTESPAAPAARARRRQHGAAEPTFCDEFVPTDAGVRDSGLILPPCGDDGFPCCTGASPCSAGLECDQFEATYVYEGYCHSPACGDSGEICCRGLLYAADSCIGDPEGPNGCDKHLPLMLGREAAERRDARGNTTP
jgi:hypothetical protein